MGKCPTFIMSTRTTVKRELPETGVHRLFICFSPSDDEQPGCNPLFLYVHHQTIIWVVSTFLLHFLSLPMWGTGQMWNWIVMTVSDFYFYFEILYWIMYILN